MKLKTILHGLSFGQRSLIVLCCLLVSPGLKLSAQAPGVSYTTISANFLTGPEVDSILKSGTSKVFRQYGVPDELFESYWPPLRQRVISYSTAPISSEFRNIESSMGLTGKTKKNTPEYTNIKALYAKAIMDGVQSSFERNEALANFLTFNKSDRITYFNSIVRVRPDGKLLVTENISVYNGDGGTSASFRDEEEMKAAGANNDEIQRGIVRAFPVAYQDSNHIFHNTTFEVKEVLKNGIKEDYHTENKDNGVLLYTGNKNVILEHGYYNYSITYITDHQVRPFAAYDELYWNATGNSWSFRIDSATCTIILPKGASSINNHCYTGGQGSRGEDCDYMVKTVGDSTYVTFRSKYGFAPNQGLTVATSWPKGFVKAQSSFSKLTGLIADNKAIFLLPLAALFSGIFCFIFWHKYGRDPKAGTIYPRFEPTPGYSPAAIGYIYHQAFDYKLTVATITDAAVRNKVRIDVEREGMIFKHNEYVFSHSDKTPELGVSTYEDFANGVEKLIGTRVAKGKYNANLAALNTAVSAYCEKHYKTKDGLLSRGTEGLFALNRSYTWIAKLVCLGAAIWAFTKGLIPALQAGAWIHGLYYVLGLIACYIVLKIFGRIMSAYNAAGRKLADEIAGFRMFLVTADEKRFDALAPPQKSLQLYEQYLPFAIALACDIEWGEKFRDIIEAAVLSGSLATASFVSSMNHGGSSFSSGFTSSFSGAISSASTPPSSSSGGSSGGGFSGGGGGGGGGGGW